MAGGREWPYRFHSFDPAGTALLVIDLQHAFLDADYVTRVPGATDIAPSICKLAGALRTSGGRVVFTRHTVADEGPLAPPSWQRGSGFEAAAKGLRAGSKGHDIHPSLAPHPQDIVFDKYRYSALVPCSSSLDRWLRDRGIETVIITGVLTNVCCESTARDAHMMGYRVFFIADATATMTDPEHNATLRTMGGYFADVRSAASMIELIGASAR
jgi:ureidoacrylate peracid hydrolase